MVCLIWSLGIASFTLGLKGENKMGLALLSINTKTTQGFDSKYCLYLLIFFLIPSLIQNPFAAPFWKVDQVHYILLWDTVL